MKNLVLAGLVVGAAQISAQAIVVGHWGFNSYAGGDPGEAETSAIDKNASLALVKVTQQAVSPGKGNSGTAWQVNDTGVSEAQRGEWTLTVDDTIGLADFTLSYERKLISGQNRGPGWEAEWDNGGLQTAAGVVTQGTPDANGWITINVNFSAVSGIENFSGPVTFRNLLQGGGAGTSSIAFDEITLTSLTPVPEPTNIALGILGVGALGYGAARRFMRRPSAPEPVA